MDLDEETLELLSGDGGWESKLELARFTTQEKPVVRSRAWRYAHDPTYRARRLAQARRWQAANYARHLAQKRAKYWADTAHRERLKAKARDYHARKSD